MDQIQILSMQWIGFYISKNYLQLNIFLFSKLWSRVQRPPKPHYYLNLTNFNLGPSLAYSCDTAFGQ